LHFGRKFLDNFLTTYFIFWEGGGSCSRCLSALFSLVTVIIGYYYDIETLSKIFLIE